MRLTLEDITLQILQETNKDRIRELALLCLEQGYRTALIDVKEEMDKLERTSEIFSLAVSMIQLSLKMKNLFERIKG